VWSCAGCVELPAEDASDGSPAADAGHAFAWPLDAGDTRPPTAPAYTGPECDGVGSVAAGSNVVPGADPAAIAAGDAAVATSPQDAAAGARVPVPVRAGEIVISELMPNPVVIDDSAGEWIELHNPGMNTLSLEPCSVDDGSPSARAVAAPLILEGGAYVTIARSQQAGFVADHVMSLSLANGADSVALICGGVEIDRVGYGGALPVRAGASLSLGSDGLWCAGTLPYGDNLGTPGAANPPCAASPADSDAGA
jgi:hypothetical protein